MGQGGPRSGGELLTLLFLLLNLLFVVLVHVTETHCQEQIAGYDDLSDAAKEVADEAQCEDIFFFTQKNSINPATGEDVTTEGLKDMDHHAGRTALAITTLSGGVYIVMLIRQGLRVLRKEKRDYTGRISIVIESSVAFLLSLVAWILILVEGGKLNDVPNGSGGTLDYSPSTGWVLLLLIWLMNLFIAVRTGLLAYMADSWPTGIGTKGSFGTGGSARVAEQYPVMGGIAA